MALQTYSFRPYCGSPPDPAHLLGRWNLDPLLAAVLAASLALYLIGSGGLPRWRRAAFCAGLAAVAAAWMSPLCALSVALFSARIAQHMWIASVAAPLLALGRPAASFRRAAWPGARAGWCGPLPAAAAFAAAMWFWHAPAAYTATFESDAAYWAMHATLLGAAVWLWASLIDRGRHLGGFALATLLTTGQMGLLGALVTFAGRPIYPPHFVTPYLWGLTPLQDQQLGGVIMWIPAGVIFAGGFALAFARLMRATPASLAAPSGAA